jgi:glycogen phosphorylase
MDISEVIPGQAAPAIGVSMNPEDIQALRRLITEKLTYATGRDPRLAGDRDWFVAAALALRDRIVDRWLQGTRNDTAGNRKRVYYLSLEFLPGRMLMDSLHNSGLTEPMRLALAELGVNLDRLRVLEPDPALGNGGLGQPGHSGPWLRHSLQSWPVPAGDPRRLAARIP